MSVAIVKARHRVSWETSGSSLYAPMLDARDPAEDRLIDRWGTLLNDHRSRENRNRLDPRFGGEAYSSSGRR